MKSIHKYLSLLIACMLTTSLSATYYIAGNGTDDPNGKWCNGTDWEFQAMDGNNSITFKGVAAGKNYGFKITNANDWSHDQYTTFDYDESDQPLYGGNGSDMGFTLTEDADVTVSFADGKVRVRATKALAYRSKYYYIVGNGNGAWCNGQDWGGNSDANKFENDQISYSSLPAGWYQFKVIKGNWEKQWQYADVDVAKSSPMHKGLDGGDICFRLQAAADVTIKMEKGKVVLLIDREYCITGMGSWAPITDKTLTLGNNYTYTFYNLSAGDYRFKVKESADAWNEDCTWGYAHFDAEHSNAGGDWDGDDHNIGFHLDTPHDVTISIVNNKICLNTVPVYFVAGNGNGSAWLNGVSGWQASAAVNRLDAETNSITYSNVPAGSYEFKVVKGAWGEGNEWAASQVDLETSSKGYQGSGTNNIKFDLQQPTDITITFNPETGKISLVSSHGYFLSNVYSVVGVESLFGSAWANMETSTEMTPKGDGTYEFIMRDKELSAGSYDYKIIGGHSWGAGCEFPTSNASVSIPEAGTYTIVFTLNPAEGTQSNVVYKQHNVTISSYGYSTFYSDKAFVLPDGLTATIYTNISGTMLTGETITTIPANTGVVLCGAANATYTLLQTTTDESYPANLLHGTTSDQVINNSNVHYILGVNGGQCGLFWPSGTSDGVGNFTNKAGKAYLEVEPAAMPAPVRGFIIAAPTVATGLDAVSVKEDNCYYDLFGRKVAEPQAGNVYIQNGKKVVLF